MAARTRKPRFFVVIFVLSASLTTHERVKAASRKIENLSGKHNLPVPQSSNGVVFFGHAQNFFEFPIETVG